MSRTRTTARDEDEDAQESDQGSEGYDVDEAQEIESVNANEEEDIELDDTLPAPTSPITTSFGTLNIPTQLRHTGDLHAFLMSNKPDYTRLNAETQPTCCAMIHVPRTDKIRIIYGIGIGVAGLTANPLNKIPLCLTGDTDRDTPIPTVMALTQTAFKPANVFVPTEEQIATHTGQWPAVRASRHDDTRATQVASILRVCPVPAYLVYDGFDDDLSTTEVAKRLKGMFNQDPAWLKHAQQFIRACLVYPKSSTPGTALADEVFATRASRATRAWGRKRFQELFPNIGNTNPQAAPPAASGTTSLPTNVAELYSQFLAMHTATTNATGTSGTAPTATTTHGMAKSDLSRLLTMCGLEQGQEEFLPTVWEHLAETGLTKEGKNNIIRDTVVATLKYHEAQVPLLAPLLTCIRTREWSGDSGYHTLTSAVKGLSPFLVTEISEDQEAAFNEIFTLMEKATLHTIEDIKLSTKVEAKIPASFHSLLQCLKAFSNLLVALFGRLCPLLVAIEDIITALAAWNPHARASLQHRHRAAIMWVLFLQTRDFTSGRMKKDDPNSHLPAFYHLRMDILAGKEVSNNSIPMQLLVDPTTDVQAPKRKATDNTSTRTDGPVDKTKKQKTPFIPHPKLTSAFGPVFAAHPTASIKKMCSVCNIHMRQLFPDNPGRCLLAALKGKCTYNKCRNDHSFTITDKEADTICRLLEPVITNPQLMANVSTY